MYHWAHPTQHRRASSPFLDHISASTHEQLDQQHHGVCAGPASAQACKNHGRNLPLMAAAAGWAAGAHQVHHLLREAAQGVSNDWSSMCHCVEAADVKALWLLRNHSALTYEWYSG
jgi:hypothetical protein